MRYGLDKNWFDGVMGGVTWTDGKSSHHRELVVSRRVQEVHLESGVSYLEILGVEILHCGLVLWLEIYSKLHYL